MPTTTPARPVSRTVHRRSTFRGVSIGACWVMVAMLVAWSTWSGAFAAALTIVSGGLLLRAIWGRPRLAFVIWLLSMLMVPVWIHIHFPATVPAHCIVAILAVAATINCTSVKFTKFDTYFVLFLTISLAAVLFGGSNWASIAQIVIRWGIPFLATRVLVSATGARFAVDVIAVLFGLVGALAVLELLLAWHPFVAWDIDGSLEFDSWHGIQIRNGTERSEWAFGHSIALGASLVLSIPFIARSSYGRFSRAALLILVGAGIATTASRGAVIAAAFTAAISLVYTAKNHIARTVAVTLTLSATSLAILLFRPLLDSWARGASGEQQVSFHYRSYLYSRYVSEFEWLGRSPLYHISRGGLSLDSEFVNIGLAFGWILLIGAVFPLTLTTLRVIIGHATVAEIAIVGQIPLLGTVALITQYESIFFLVVGLAVQMIIAEKEHNRPNHVHSVASPTSAAQLFSRRDIRWRIDHNPSRQVTNHNYAGTRDLLTL